MATLRQIALNRLDDEKKNPSATHHDVPRLDFRASGAGVVPPDEEDAAVAARLNSWRDGFPCETVEDEWLLEAMVVASIRLDRCWHHESALRTQAALRARLTWDDDRRLAAEELFAGLSRKPALIVRKLRQTKQGCEALLERWRALGSIVARGREWNKTQVSLALDMLGVPRELRVPDAAPWLDAGVESPSELVGHEIDRLERLKSEALDELDECERASAAMGLESEPSRPLGLLMRFEASCQRQFAWARNRLQRNRRVSAPPRALPRLAPPPVDLPVPQDENRQTCPPDRLSDNAARAALPSSPKVVVESVPCLLSAPAVPEPVPSNARPELVSAGNRRARRAAARRAGRG